jgi:putative colanic acid biosynthesis glycosyltransferase
LHAEFMYTGNCGHAFDCEKWLTGCGNCPQLWKATKSIFLDRTSYAWQKMAEVFNGFNNLSVVSVSSWLSERAKRSPILKDKKNIVIENGIDTKDVFHPTDSGKLRKKYKIGDEKVILHVTANFSDKPDNIKGGYFIIKLAKKLKNENIKFFVIGGQSKNIALPENIINIGRIDDKKGLAAFYSMADLTVIASKKETFSLPCAESMACGTPVVGFKAGGPETIALKDFSEFVEYGDLEKLLHTVMNWINKKRKITKDLEKIAVDFYSNSTMVSKYLELYNTVK